MSNGTAAGDLTARPSSLSYASSSYTWYVLIMLLVVHVFGHLDRMIMNVVVEPVKAEFGLGDDIMGLLTGAAFSIFYALFGIPLALWADRRRRTWLISFSVAVWSAMTVVCGLAWNAMSLILARIGVAIGEAGSNPASHSMIADIFPAARRATPMAILSMGPTLGIMIGFAAGGWLSETYGWQWAFIGVGAPGILVALLFVLTVREPERGQADGRSVETGDPGLGLRAVFATLKVQKSLVFIILGFCFAAFFGFGAIAWLAAFFGRSYGMTEGEAGLRIGFVVGAFGGLGTLAGGLLADRLGRRDVRWRLWVICVAGLIAVPFSFLAYLSFDPVVTLWLTAIPAAVSVFHAGPSFALVQGLVDIRIRAMTVAFMLFCVNVIGGGIGPYYVGLMSEWLRPEFGQESLRYALLSLTVPSIISVVLFMLATRTLKDDLVRAGSDH